LSAAVVKARLKSVLDPADSGMRCPRWLVRVGGREGARVQRRYRDLGGGVWLLAAALLLGGCEKGTPGPTTREEAQRIARSLTRVVGPPAGGWALSRTRAGAPVVQLRGRLQEVMIAGQAADGSLRTTCVSSPEEAERFLAPAAPGGSGR
jgi:hypothetical protein